MRLIILLSSFLLLVNCSGDQNLSESSDNSNGTLSGSYANILAIENFLYLISDSDIITYDINTGSEPKEINRQNLGFGVESLFHRGGILFIGSQTALHIYDISSSGIPFELSTTDYQLFQDFCSSDPVVTNDSLAYVTLSTQITRACERANVNELRFYDIKDINEPTLVGRYPMIEPKGLGLDNEILFVCEKSNGLKILNVKDISKVEELYHFDGFEAFDVIPRAGLLLVIGPENLYQFDYTDLSDIKLISEISLL